MTGQPISILRGNWMKMNKQKTEHRWRKAAEGLLALLLSFGMACSAFAETAVGAGALRKSAAAGVQMVDAGMQDAAARADNTPRRMENCVVKLDPLFGAQRTSHRHRKCLQSCSYTRVSK